MLLTMLCGSDVHTCLAAKGDRRPCSTLAEHSVAEHGHRAAKLVWVTHALGQIRATL